MLSSASALQFAVDNGFTNKPVGDVRRIVFYREDINVSLSISFITGKALYTTKWRDVILSTPWKELDDITLTWKGVAESISILSKNSF